MRHFLFGRFIRNSTQITFLHYIRATFPKAGDGVYDPLGKFPFNEPIKVILLAQPCTINHLCEFLIAVVRQPPESNHTLWQNSCSFFILP